MKISTVLLLILLLAAPAVMAQNYPLVPLDSIQWVPPGQDSSRYTGDTVTTGGLVTAGTGTLYAGTGVTFYMEDPAGGLFSGVLAYSSDAQGYPTLYPGDSILCNARVSEYNWSQPPLFCTMTELLIVPGSFQFRMYGMPEPIPLDVFATEIDSAGNADSLAEKYEGVFIKVHDITIDSVINYTTTSTWICHDSTGQCYIREASDSISNSFRPRPGTVFDFIQGVVYDRFGIFSVEPRYMRDMRLGRGAPIVSTNNSPAFPLLNDPVTITAHVVDDEPLPPDSVRLYYRINLGTWTNVPMTHQLEDVFTFTLPSPVAGWQVDYFIHAVDDSNNVTNEPYEAPFSFYEYTVQQARTMTIAQARVDANGDFIPDLLDSAVIVTGIAVSSNFSTTQTNFFMDQGHAGINVFFDTLMTINIGDSITANGIVNQFQGKTELQVYKRNRITNFGPGHIPDTLAITCADLADVNGEQYEGVLVRVNNVEIVATPNAWPTLGLSSTMTIVAGSDSADLRIDKSTDIDGQLWLYNRANIVGVVGQYDLYDPFNGFYQLMPRQYTDFIWLGNAAGEDNLPNSYALMQNYPNPFNPNTSISFSLRERGHVNISIYNLMGQKVSNIVDQVLGAGTHIVEWNGVDSKGQRVTSGVYFYKMETDNYSATKKMVLLK
jgi:hypothetical protein